MESEFPKERPPKGFLSQIQSSSNALKRNAETIITTKDGKRFVEKRDPKGNITLESLPTSTAGFVVDTKPDKELHQVVNHLFVGSQDSTVNEEELRARGVSHILNVASGIENANIAGITYLTREILDVPETNIVEHLPPCNQFIMEGMAAGGVLVHCNAGVSRSVSIIIGFLMTVRKLPYQEAYDLVKAVRPAAQPNDGFRRQLLAYEGAVKCKQGPAMHKLQTSWTLWFDKKGTKQNYAEHLRKLGTFDTIEGLWDHYAHLQRPEHVPIDHSYHCFRETVIPMWETFPNGSCWIVKMEKGSNNLTKLWEQLLFSTVGEIFGTPNVVGVVLSIRAQEDFISVWMKDSSIPMNCFKIGEKMKKLLSVDPNFVFEYKTNTVALKDHSSFRNTDPFLL